MAAGAVQLRMLSEIAAVYDVQLSAEYIEQVGRQMAQTLFKLGIAEAAAGVLGGLLKFNPLGFMAGGVVQAVTMAYLDPPDRRRRSWNTSSTGRPGEKAGCKPH